ncbi:MAG: DUF4158 domain-containing protein [Streptosporangiaceae bacterium]
MPAGQFPDDQLERLRTFPDIGRDDLIRYFTLTPADVAFLDPGRGRGPADRLGVAVALATLPWLGFVPDEVRAAPPAAVARLAERLGLDPAVLAGYGQRAHTRTDHVRLVAGYLGGRAPRRAVQRSRTWSSSCWTGRWSMTRRGCCSPWRPST